LSTGGPSKRQRKAGLRRSVLFSEELNRGGRVERDNRKNTAEV